MSREGLNAETKVAKATREKSELFRRRPFEKAEPFGLAQAQKNFFAGAEPVCYACERPAPVG